MSFAAYSLAGESQGWAGVLVDACIELPRRTPNTAYDKEIGGDNSVELKDTPEERKKDLEYMREEYRGYHVWQEFDEGE